MVNCKNKLNQSTFWRVHTGEVQKVTHNNTSEALKAVWLLMHLRYELQNPPGDTSLKFVLTDTEKCQNLHQTLTDYVML